MARTVKALIGSALAAALVVAALAPAAGAAEDGARQTAKLRFTSTQPGAPTGHRLRIDYLNPDDPDAKPPAVRRVTEIFHRGTRFDTAAPELCTASDPELILLGTAACSEGSWIGDGLITLDTGLPQPGRFIASPVDFLNNTDENIFVNRLLATESPTVITRAQVSERSVSAEAPFLPGTPPDGAAIDTVRADYPPLVTERGSYLTTPPRCPRRGFWRNRIQFTYDDGVTQTVVSHSRCEGGGDPGRGRGRGR